MITFATPGTIDPISFTMMGVNVKESSSAIGYFGTGLKYAIAVLLRCGCDIEIVTPDAQYAFDKRKLSFRGKELDAIYCTTTIHSVQTEERMPFTTDLGKNWSPLMAYRELESNTRDEDGETFEGGHAQHNVTWSYITVTGTPIDNAHANRHQMFLDKQLHTLLYADEEMGIEVYSGSNSGIYAKGIRVHQAGAAAYRFTYNILNAYTLTEDRTILLGNGACYDITRRFTKMPRDMCDEFLQSIDATCAEHQWHHVYSMNEHMAHAAIDFYRAGGHVNQYVIEQAREILKIKPPRDSADVEQDEQEMLDDCLDAMSLVGMNVEDHEFKVIVVADLQGKLGEADMDDKIIYITHGLFLEGKVKLCGTLIEEFIHLKHKVYDETRQMQEVLVTNMGRTALRYKKLFDGASRSELMREGDEA